MSVSRTWFPRLNAAVLLSVFALSSFVVAETTEGLTPSPGSMDRQAATERQPSSITGVLMQARGSRATAGGFLNMVNGVDKGPPPPSDCCPSGAKGTPGCDDATCESDVCEIDSVCCDTDWDSKCEDLAASICEVCGGTPPGPDILVNTNADGIPADDGFCTLREAVMTANGVFFGFKTEGECESFEVKGFGPPPDPTTIGFDPALAGATISLTITDVSEEGGIDPKGPPPSSVSDFFGPTALWVTSNISIVGDPDDGIIIERDSSGPDMRLFLIVDVDFFDCLIDKGGPCDPCPKGGCPKGFGPGDAAVAFENVTLQGGIARGGDGGDGGFDQFINNKGNVNGGSNVSEATLEGGGGGGAAGFGGAVFNVFGFVSFENSTLNNNQAIGGNGGVNGAAMPEPKPKGGPDLDATGGGGGGIAGDGFDGGDIGSEAGEGGGADGGTSPGSSGFFGGGGAGANESFSGGDGGGVGGGGGGASVAVSVFDKGDFSVNGRDAGDNFFIGGGGGGGAMADIVTNDVKGDSEGLPGFGGFGAGDGSFQTGGGGAGMGGAVFNFGGAAISINSTFSGNAAIGGTGVDDPAPPPKGTLGSTQGAGLGGGIINVSGFVFMNNTTLSGNRADEGGGAVFHLEAGDLDPECLFKGDCFCAATTVVFDSILANSPNSATDFDGNDINGSCFKGLEPGLVFVENSLIETFAKTRKGGSNVIGGEPLLGPLADNGGPNNTHLPQPGSPVIDAVITPTPKTEGAVFDPLTAKGGEFGPVFCEETDQRGVERIQLAECDMGSVEVLPATITICKTEDPAPPQPKTLGWNFEGDLGVFGLNHGQCTDPFSEAPDTYTVTELSNEPFFYLGAINCVSDGTLDVSVDVPSRDVDITVVEDENVTCTFVNEQAGNITITKATNVATAELFGFNHDIPVPPPPKEGEKGPGPDFTLASGASQVFNLIQPGTYGVSEIDPFPENFALNTIVCDDGNSSGSGLTATINLEPGENVECTFNNVELEAQLSLKKNADGVPTDAFVGDQYVYHLILTNNGPGFGTNVVVLDPLSPLLAFVSSACATEDPPGTVRWEVGTILAGQSLFCDFTVEILEFGIIENVAFADGDQGDGGGENEGRVIVKGATPIIPTLGPWALGLLALVLGFAGVARIRRR